MILPFEEWRPDAAALANGSLRALNLVPSAEGYESAPGLVLSTAYPTLPETPMRVVAFTLSDGTVGTLAFCQANIYELRGSVWAKVTRRDATDAFVPYATEATGFWSCVQWGDTVYAVNYSNALQKYQFGGIGFFENVSGLPGGIRARFLVIIRDFLVLFDTNDSTGANATPYRMHWSGRLRPEDFDPSLVTGAGWRDIADIGMLVACSGGEYGYLNGTEGAVRLDTIGPPLQFAVARVDEDVGCLYRGTMVKVGGAIFWYSQKGWRKSTGGASIPIGESKVDRFFRRRVDSSLAHLITSAVLRDKAVLFYSYASTDSVDGLPDEAIFHNYNANRWSEGSYKIRLLGTAGKSPLFVDDITYGEQLSDDIAESVDDQAGKRPALIAVNAANKILAAVPSTSNAIIETKEIQLTPGRRSQVHRVRLIAEGASDQYEARVSSRDRQPSMEVARDPWLKPEKTGACGANKHGRYHRVAFRLTGEFTSVLGAEIDFSPRGSK